MSQQLTFDLNVDNKQAIDQLNTFFDAFDAGVKDVGKKLDDALNEKNVKIELRMEGGKVVAKEVKEAASQGNKLEKAAKVITGEFGKTSDEVNNSITLLRALLGKTKKYKGNTKEVTEEWKRLVTLIREARGEAAEFKISEEAERSITGANIAAGLALDAIRGLARGFANLVSEGIQMEVLMIQLEGFTGSLEAADEAFNEFLRIAAATPFNVTQVAAGARTMMGFGLSTAEATHRIEQLAIVAAATGGELSHMARNLGQIQANQRAYTRDLMQFANQGIPIYQMLADVMGTTTQTIREMAEEGKIGFYEVAAALDLMTQKGSAYEAIAAKMDRTVAARMEALQGMMQATAGKFVMMFNEMDAALGGPLSNSLKLLINIMEWLGDRFDDIRRNAKAVAPAVVFLGTAIAGAVGIATVQNWSTIIDNVVKFGKAIKVATALQKAFNATKAIFAALTGNWIALAAVAAAAAGAYVLFRGESDKAKDAQEGMNQALANEQFDAAADGARTLAFSLTELNSEQKKVMKDMRKEYGDLQKAYGLQQGGIQRTIQYLEMQGEKTKQNHQDDIDDIKTKIQAEKDGYAETSAIAKRSYDERIRLAQEELNTIRKKFQDQLADLDQESKYAKRLKEIRKEEIQNKLNATDLSEKETLELKEQLHQMEMQEKRARVLTQQKKEEEVAEQRLKDAQNEKVKGMEALKTAHDERISDLEEERQTHLDAIKAVNEEIEAQKNKLKGIKNEELAAIYENKEAAIQSLDLQIRKAGELKDLMREAYLQAKTFQQRARAENQEGRASGGPVSGGTKYTVNEMGKEAFLSASGKLSMINAPSFGTWKAPGAGTVIPAHLTNQLDIPSGGINLNRAAGANAGMTAGSGAAMVKAIRAGMSGDTFNQSVTVQSANPTQTANNMMVEMTRLKRRRFR